jgi:LysR family transcriptional activator of glutamate synthase operon
MDVKQMQYFIAIVEIGSFTTAAETLYISQSSLSKRIMALEKELGVQLFDRGKRGVALTQAGEIVLERACVLVKTYQTMISDLEEFRAAAPQLTIAAIPVIAQYGISALVAQFKSLHPDIKFALEERLVSEILPGLDSRQYDLAFVRDNYIDRSQYSCLEISRDRLVAVVSERSRYAGRASVSLAELSGESFIMYDKGTGIYRLSFDACLKAGFEPEIFYASQRVDNIISLVASGMGVALLMEKVFDYHDHAGVAAIPLDEIIESSIMLVSPKDARLSGPARTFVALITKLLEARHDSG